MNLFTTYLEEIDINSKLVAKLRRLSKLEKEGFKRLAYAKAATTIANLDVPITDIENLASLPGVGASIRDKIDEFISTGEIQKLNAAEKLETKTTGIKRINKDVALSKVDPLIRAAKRKALTYEICGSIRRGELNVKDVDILALKSEMPQWYNIIDKLDTKKVNRGDVSTDFLLNGVSVNIRSVEKSTWGAGLLFLTGPQMFNVNLRSQAKKKGMLLNQHGLFERDTGKFLTGRSEESIFRVLGIKYISPEKR